MIFVHEPSACPSTGQPLLERRPLDPHEPIPESTTWIDLVQPTRQEDHRVEAFLGIAVPTREEMQDIEPSEVIYAEHGARYMTARLLCKVDEEAAGLAGVTFVLKDRQLLTVRYEDPQAFRMFAARAARPAGTGRSAEAILSGLVDTIIDRAADVLQLQGTRIDALSRDIFAEQNDPKARNKQLQATLRALGYHGDLISKQRESLVSVERVLLSLSALYRAGHVGKDLREDVRSSLRDLQSLEEHATFLASKIQFLLDATLGLVNLEQNNIIKLFSVMAVVFMPPTLIASIYGMNFKAIPELDWTLGYPMALVMMVVAAVLPYLLFRWKRWL